jgi:formylglycine-generating enzyme required for sulfatase activity
MPDADNRPLKVFLCHASQDKPKVRELYQRLKAEGWIDPWLDVAKILPGQHWTSVIRQSLADADAIIILISCSSTSKEGFIQREMNYAWDLSLEKPRSVIFLIPLRLEECDVPYDLRERQWADYFGERQEDTYAALLQSLKLRHAQVLRLDAEERARKEAAERARQEREEQERKVAREKNRIEAEERARRDAEEKARKEKEVLDVKATEELKRKRDEGNARLAKEARERKAAEEQARKAAEKPRPVTVVEPRHEPVTLVEKKQPRKVDFRWWGIGGAVLLILFCAIFGIYYLINHWPFEATPVSTVTLTPSRTPTKDTATFTPARPLTPTDTPSPTATFTPAPGIGSTWTRPADGMMMVYVPEGEFTMGSNSYSNEQPIHTVYVDTFWMDQTEVTNKMYSLCVAAGKCNPPSSNSSYTRQSYYGNSEYDDFPVIYVSWNDADAYCKWAGGRDYTVRLPTEAEWEKAASWDANKQEKRTYPWGDSIDCTLANYWGKDNGCVGDTTKVGSYPSGASFYGALDTAGNVWEWVADWYSSSYYSTLQDGVRNPAGPSSGDGRVLRGGSWNYNAYNARSAYRGRGVPTVSNDVIGFRCSRSR